jgi:hypothetical protein
VFYPLFTPSPPNYFYIIKQTPTPNIDKIIKMKNQATPNSKSPQAKLILHTCGAFTTMVSKKTTNIKKKYYTK